MLFLCVVISEEDKQVQVLKKHWLAEKLNLHKVFDSLLSYFDIQIELVKLQVKEQLVEVLTAFVVMIMVISMGLFILLFASLGVGILLNNYFGSMYLGFIIVSVFFLIICLLIIVFRKELITNRFFRLFFEKTISDKFNNKGDEQT